MSRHSPAGQGSSITPQTGGVEGCYPVIIPCARPPGGSDGDQYRKAEIHSGFRWHRVCVAARRARGANRDASSRVSQQQVSDESKHLVAAFRTGLQTGGGYVEGQNVAIEYRWAEGQYARLPEMAADLVRRGVAVIVAAGGEPSTLAAKAATSTIPIIFSVGGDPVKSGLVASISHPGGNATGVSLLTEAPEGKRLGLLKELAPSATVFGVYRS